MYPPTHVHNPIQASCMVKRISIIRHSKLSNNSTSALPIRFPPKENQFRLLVKVDFSASGKHYISAGHSSTLSVSSLLQFSFSPFYLLADVVAISKDSNLAQMVPDAVRLGCFRRVAKLETLRIEAKCSAIQGSAGNGILTQKSIPYPGRC